MVGLDAVAEAVKGQNQGDAARVCCKVKKLLEIAYSEKYLK